MTSPAAATAEGPSSAPSATVVAESHPAIRAVASALLLSVAFPPVGWSWLAWVALVPLFLLVESRRSRAAIYFGSWLGGYVFWLIAIRWIAKSDPGAWVAWLVMALALSAFWPAFVLLARLGVRRLGLPLMLVAPVAWLALEYVRAYLVTGFPWYYLAHTQYRVLPIIQIADFAGAWGPSLLLAIANAAVVGLLNRPLLRAGRLARGQVARLATIGLLVFATVGYGSYRLNSAAFREGPRVALIQSDLPQIFNQPRDPNKLRDHYIGLIDRAVARPGRLDLIVWPETAYPFVYPIQDPKLGDADFLELIHRTINPKHSLAFWKGLARDVPQDLHLMADRVATPMLVGLTEYHFTTEGLKKYNAAALFEPGKTTRAVYHKIHLVPFGEYVPLVDTFSAVLWLTPFDRDHAPDLTPGTSAGWIERGPWRLATAICFEDTVPQVVRGAFSAPPEGRQPDLLVNLSNDGWFRGTPEHRVHLATSVFRAVENRVPLVRAVNTGISAMVDGNGLIRAALPAMVEDVLIVDCPLDDRASFYSRAGDWLALSCLALTIGLTILAIVRPRRVRDEVLFASLPKAP